MGVVFIPFDGWRPGAGSFGEGWETATDSFPYYESNRALGTFVAESTPVAFGPMVGSHAHLWMINPAAAGYQPDTATLFTGSPTRLWTYTRSTGLFADVSRAANYGAAGDPAGWRFASVGNDIWATNWIDPLQRRTNNAGLFANGVTSTFTPVPRFLATVREHLAVANLNQAGRFQDEIAWSDADNAVNFDPPTGTSTSIAGSKRLTSVSGQITGLLGGQYGLVFKRRGIFYLEYTGTTQVFRPDVLSPHIGTAYPSSIINSRYGVFFFGPDGFYQMVGLAAPVKISPPSVDQFIFESTFQNQLVAFSASKEDTQLYGFHSAMVPLVGWAWRINWSIFSNTQIITHNPVTQEWCVGGLGDLGLTTLVNLPYDNNRFSFGGYTYDGAQSGFSSYSQNTVRAPVYRLRYRPANFEKATELAQSQIKGIQPVFSKSNAGALTESVMVESLLNPNDNQEPAAKTETRVYTDRNLAGWYPFQITGRFFRVTISCAAEDFDNFEGAFIDQELLT